MTETSVRQALGKLIATLRAKQNLSQEQLAFESQIDRTWLGEIERGTANPTIETLEKIAKVIGQSLGSLIVNAEQINKGIIRNPTPVIRKDYINRSIPLPKGLSHEQLEIALNNTLTILDQIGLNPENKDIQQNIYSGVVSNVVTKAIAEASSFVQNKDTNHPDLYNPKLDTSDLDWGLEIKASNKVNKGGESHNPGEGWFIIVIYKIISGQNHIIQVEATTLKYEDWTINERSPASKRTRTAVTKREATCRLRENSVYLDPRYVTIMKK